MVLAGEPETISIELVNKKQKLSGFEVLEVCV